MTEVDVKKVFVCAGMGLAKNEDINIQARRLGEILAGNNDIVYVQGGSDQGLMGETLKSFIKTSNRVEFLIPDRYFEYDSPNLIKLVGEQNFKYSITKGEAGRLQGIKDCDYIVVLPGGSGTLEELLYCNETLRSGEHTNKVVIVNIAGYYNGFLQQLKAMLNEGLFKESAIRFKIVDSVDELDFNNNLRS